MIDFLIAYILAPLLVLAVVIFVHEFGHFRVARYFRVATPVFSIGFGREIFGVTDRQGTRWKFSLFPLGGYVKIEEHDGLPLYQRVVITAAGPMANFIFAVVLMFFVFVVYGSPSTAPDIVAVNTKGGAYEAGVRPGDKILQLDGHALSKEMDDIKEIIQKSEKSYLEAVIQRNNQEKFIKIPVRDFDETGDFGEEGKRRMLGVVFAGNDLKLKAINRVADIDTKGNIVKVREEIVKFIDKDVVINFGLGKEHENFLVHINGDLNRGILDKDNSNYSSLVLWDFRKTEFHQVSIGKSLSNSIDLLYQAVRKTLGVFYQMIVGKKDTGDLGGVVAIGSMTGEVTENSIHIGPYYIFKLLAILSINIGFINLLPFPMLDGGHLVFHAIEAIRGRPPSLKVKGYFYGFGIVFIAGVIIMANLRDMIEIFSSK